MRPVAPHAARVAVNRVGMAEPDLFTSVTARSRGMTVGVTARGVIMTLFALISFAALIGFIGQRPSTSTAATPSARMTLSAPTTVRGGIFFQSRISIRALATIEHPRLVLDSGWTEGL